MQPTVLIVDDNPSIVHTLLDILSLKGIGAIGANTGRDALQLLERPSIRILLSDVRMPDMDGVTLFRQAQALRADLITFLMTAYTSDEMLVDQALQEGVRTILTKPLDIDLLLSLIGAASHLTRQRPTGAAGNR